MYANEPLDAESYLLVAQQLNPQDPIPYVNLGILYDRHLRQPFVAVEFYECYTALAGTQSDQGRSIAMRITELREKFAAPAAAAHLRRALLARRRGWPRRRAPHA